MTRFFERGTALAEMERQMMMVPNVTPRGNGSAVLCRYRTAAADVDCQSCVRHCGGAGCRDSPAMEAPRAETEDHGRRWPGRGIPFCGPAPHHADAGDDEG